MYGGGEQTEENQMPVEESGNMLILMLALAQAEGKRLQYRATYACWVRPLAFGLRRVGITRIYSKL